MFYRLRMSDGVSEETTVVDADTLEDAAYQADAETRLWVRGGDWGFEGAAVTAHWELYDGDTMLDHGGVTVDIEPDHEALIVAACGGPLNARYRRCCGKSPDAHDWTSEGEGGCDENPGVWSVGGTALVFQSHCRTCGLRRREKDPGSQRNPGDHPTVEYDMPEDWS